MKIKSYFDSSVPTAMRQARHEFGDDVMLVTSRIASPELRYLGDFEVVFAIDEAIDRRQTEPQAVLPPQPEPPPSAFGEMFRLACATPPAGDAREAAIIDIRSRLLEMGLDPATTEGVTALIRLCAPRPASPPPLTGAAHDPVLSPPGNQFVVGYGPFSTGESSAADPGAPDAPAPSERMSVEPEPAAEFRDPRALDLTPKTAFGYELVSWVEPAADHPAAAERMSEEPEPKAELPEPRAIDFTPGTEESAIRPPPVRIPIWDEYNDSRAVPYAVPAPLRTSVAPLSGNSAHNAPLRAASEEELSLLRSRAPAAGARKGGFALMLAAFSLYGIMRRSGS